VHLVCSCTPLGNIHKKYQQIPKKSGDPEMADILLGSPVDLAQNAKLK
jgi:hypothetical protein